MKPKFREARDVQQPTFVVYTAKKDGSMPEVQPGKKMVQIRFRTCKDAQLVIFVGQLKGTGDFDRTTGVPLDAWYVIRAPGLPDRFIRIFSGPEGLHDMLLRYAFQDSQGCKHEKHMQIEYADAYRLEGNAVEHIIPKKLSDALGIPQFYKKSGNCWFASMCWVLFGNDEVCEFVCKCFVEAGAPEIAAWAKDAFHDPDKAEMIRRKLWHDHRIGDDVDAPPDKDGQNGGSQLILVCDAYKIPLRVLECRGNTLHETRSARQNPHLLLVRCQDQNHDTDLPLRRFFGDRKGTYKLVSGLIGQRKCGHQQAFCNVADHTYAFTDSDAHKMFKRMLQGWRRIANMSPIYFCFEGQPSSFADVFKYMIFVTKYGNDYSKYCNFSIGLPNAFVEKTQGIMCEDPSSHPLRQHGVQIVKSGARRGSTCDDTLTVDLLYFLR